MRWRDLGGVAAGLARGCTAAQRNACGDQGQCQNPLALWMAYDWIAQAWIAHGCPSPGTGRLRSRTPAPAVRCERDPVPNPVCRWRGFGIPPDRRRAQADFDLSGTWARSFRGNLPGG